MTTILDQKHDNYIRLHCEAFEYIRQMDEGLNDVQCEGIDWGHIGDLSRAVYALKEAARLIDGLREVKQP